MLNQLKYFQAVVRCNSFTEAAQECHISQSAISQQIQALENELGVRLLQRENRKFSVTPAGEHFYKKSLILTADYERLCRETARIANKEEAQLGIGIMSWPITVILSVFRGKFFSRRIWRKPGLWCWAAGDLCRLRGRSADAVRFCHPPCGIVQEQ